MKKAKAKKPPKAKKQPKANKPRAHKTTQGHNSDSRSFDEKRASFLHHRTAWNGAKAKVEAAKKIMDGVVSDAKADGVSKKELQMADTLMGLGGEATIKQEVHTRLRVARYLGLAIGNQMDLFEEPDRTPSADRAYDDGKMASMNNLPRKPPHDPSTIQYERWMAGYADHQSTLAATLGRGKPDETKDPRPAHLRQRDAERTVEETAKPH